MEDVKDQRFNEMQQACAEAGAANAVLREIALHCGKANRVFAAVLLAKDVNGRVIIVKVGETEFLTGDFTFRDKAKTTEIDFPHPKSPFGSALHEELKKPRVRTQSWAKPKAIEP